MLEAALAVGSGLGLFCFAGGTFSCLLHVLQEQPWLPPTSFAALISISCLVWTSALFVACRSFTRFWPGLGSRSGPGSIAPEQQPSKKQQWLSSLFDGMLFFVAVTFQFNVVNHFDLFTVFISHLVLSLPVLTIRLTEISKWTSQFSAIAALLFFMFSKPQFVSSENAQSKSAFFSLLVYIVSMTHLHQRSAHLEGLTWRSLPHVIKLLAVSLGCALPGALYETVKFHDEIRHLRFSQAWVVGTIILAGAYFTWFVASTSWLQRSTMSAVVLLASFVALPLANLDTASHVKPFQWLSIGYACASLIIMVLFSTSNTTLSKTNYSLLPFTPYASALPDPEKDSFERKRASSGYDPQESPTIHAHSMGVSKKGLVCMAVLLCAPLVVTAMARRKYPLPSDPVRSGVALRPYPHIWQSLVMGSAIEGNKQTLELYEALRPTCPVKRNVTLWQGDTRTVLASWPRSGNTMTREMVERATGFATTTVSYCDQELLKTFKYECVHSNGFLIKDHVPWYGQKIGNYFRRYNRAVHLVRNPIDAIVSEYSLRHAPKIEGNHLNHTARIQDKLTIEKKDVIGRYIQAWKDHADYWAGAPMYKHHLRYEDLLETPVSALSALVNFLLPRDQQPTLAEIACATELNPGSEAYRSSKRPAFSSWDAYDDELRLFVVRQTKSQWCRYGWDELLRSRIENIPPEIDNLCSSSVDPNIPLPTV